MIDPTAYNLSRLLLYCGLNGIENVLFKNNKQDEYDTDTRVITINKRHVLKSQLYILLHEYGHHCIVRDERLNKKFATIIDRDPNNTLSEQILAIEEEVLAWNFGEEVAKILDIDLTGKDYQVLKAKCLKSHIKSYTKIIDSDEEE